MTDNEKRAHDLAIACVQVSQRKLLSSPYAYDLYKSDYDFFLESLNKDYPDIDKDKA